jgi:hypothetical protein
MRSRSRASSAARRVLLCLALLGPAGFAAADAPAGDAIAKLKRSGEVACQPALPFFCGNVHLSCSGQTALPTFAFKLRATPTHGSIEPAHETARFGEHYENGPVEWDAEGRYVILRPRLTRGYIKLLSDGSYSFRHYAQHAGVMSLGRCH